MKLSDIAAQLESAVAKRDKAKAAVDAAELVVKAANTNYQGAVNDIKNLDKEYQAVIKGILSHGGAVNVG
jgi:hypothetical protein